VTCAGQRRRSSRRLGRPHQPAPGRRPLQVARSSLQRRKATGAIEIRAENSKPCRVLTSGSVCYSTPPASGQRPLQTARIPCPHPVLTCAAHTAVRRCILARASVQEECYEKRPLREEQGGEHEVRVRNDAGFLICSTFFRISWERVAHPACTSRSWSMSSYSALLRKWCGAHLFVLTLGSAFASDMAEYEQARGSSISPSLPQVRFTTYQACPVRSLSRLLHGGSARYPGEETEMGSLTSRLLLALSCACSLLVPTALNRPTRPSRPLPFRIESASRASLL
jgi:hypothetical protein